MRLTVRALLTAVLSLALASCAGSAPIAVGGTAPPASIRPSSNSGVVVWSNDSWTVTRLNANTPQAVCARVDSATVAATGFTKQRPPACADAEALRGLEGVVGLMSQNLGQGMTLHVGAARRSLKRMSVIDENSSKRYDAQLSEQLYVIELPLTVRALVELEYADGQRVSCRPDLHFLTQMACKA